MNSRYSQTLDRRFCVIGSQVARYNVDRTWCRDIETATRHAIGLLGRKDNVNSGTTELYVVEVRRVVRTTAVPHEVIDVLSDVGQLQPQVPIGG